MKLNSLYDLYVGQLKDMHSAEKQLTEALPKMASAATSPELSAAFESHLDQTKIHLKTVRGLLNDLDENPSNSKCKGMEGLLEEGNEVIREQSTADAKDAALIVAAQKVEHYEIATYGGLRAFAKTLGYDDAEAKLHQTLYEEYEADKHLNDLAEGVHRYTSINLSAMN